MVVFSEETEEAEPLTKCPPLREHFGSSNLPHPVNPQKCKQTCDNSRAWFNFQTAKKTSHNTFFRFLMPTKIRQIFWSGGISSKKSISVLRQTMTLQRSKSDQAEYPTQARKRLPPTHSPLTRCPPPQPPTRPGQEKCACAWGQKRK